MLCHAAEHLVYAVMPPRRIPTPDSVVYNDSMFVRDSQGNHVFTQFCILSSKNPWYCHENSLVVANRIPWSLPNKIPGSATLLHPHKGVSQAVAWAVKGNQVPVVGQAVNHGCRHLVIGKNGAPFGKLQIGGNDQAAPFVAA